MNCSITPLEAIGYAIAGFLGVLSVAVAVGFIAFTIIIIRKAAK